MGRKVKGGAKKNKKTKKAKPGLKRLITYPQRQVRTGGLGGYTLAFVSALSYGPRVNGNVCKYIYWKKEKKSFVNSTGKLSTASQASPNRQRAGRGFFFIFFFLQPEALDVFSGFKSGRVLAFWTFTTTEETALASGNRSKVQIRNRARMGIKYDL